MQNLNWQSWTPIDIVGSNIKVNERSGNNVSQIFPHERGTWTHEVTLHFLFFTLKFLWTYLHSTLQCMCDCFIVKWLPYSFQFSSVTQSCPTLCDPMNRSTPGLPVHHQLPEFTQTHIHRVSDAIQPSHPLSSPSPPAPNHPQHQGLLQWVNSSHEVAKVLEFQLQHQSFQWTPRTDLL